MRTGKVGAMSESPAFEGSSARRSGLATVSLYAAAAFLAIVAIAAIASAFLPDEARAQVRGSWWFAAAVGLLLVSALVSPDIRDALAGIKLAVAVISLLAAASVVGTMFPQHPEIEPGDAGRILAEITDGWKPALARAYTRFGLWDVWHTWWYRALLLVVLLSAAACTINRLRSVLRRYSAPRVILGPKAFDALRAVRKTKWSEGLAACGDLLEARLRARRWTVFREDRDAAVDMLARRGGIALFGSSVVHVSLLVILAAGLWGTSERLGAWHGHVTVLEGGMAVEPNADLYIECTDFEIEYTEMELTERRPGMPKTYFAATDYLSRLVLYEPVEGGTPDKVVRVLPPRNAQERTVVLPADYEVDPSEGASRIVGLRRMGSADVEVNFPGRALGVDLFQSDWDLRGVRLTTIAPDGAESAEEVALEPGAMSGRPEAYTPHHRGIALSSPGQEAEGGAAVDMRVLAVTAFAQRMDDDGSTWTAGARQAPRPALRVGVLSLGGQGGLDEQTLGWIRPGESIEHEGHILRFDDVIYATGLSTRRQPGVWLLMSGFVLSGIGLALCFWVPVREVRIRAEARPKGVEVRAGMPKSYKGDDAAKLVEAILGALGEEKA